MDGDLRIGGRVVFVHVDAVEDARQMLHPGAEQAVQPLAVIGRLDFVGIGRADGGDLVGEHDAALHERAHAEELEVVGGIGPFAQREQILHHADGEDALILKVVDGVDGADAAIHLQMLILRAEQHGNHARLPVVAVQHVGDEVDLRQRFQHRAAEEGKALALVAAQAVDVIPAEILLGVDEIEGDALVFQLLHADVLMPPAEVDVEIQHMLHLFAPLCADRLVKRQNDAHILTVFPNFLRQRADHVGQSAGLDERDTFGRSKQNFHFIFPPVRFFQSVTFLPMTMGY